MIEISRLNISFKNREILKDAHISICDGKLTAIIGPSGSGKTSLLYCIGLISGQDNYTYNYNGRTVNLKSDKEKSDLRKKEIGYIFQDNNLFEDLSVRENLKIAGGIAGIEPDEAEIEELLRYVRLEVDTQAKVRNLSGGEKQRLAIACVLVKKPSLIIADEPTSALDGYNTEVMLEILRKAATEENVMVVIATHSEEVYKQADAIYRVENKKPVQIKGHPDASGESSPKGSGEKAPRRGSKYISCYISANQKRNRVSRLAMIVLCAFAIAICSCSATFGTGVVNKQKETMNMLSNREVFATNLTVPGDRILDYAENLCLSDEEMDFIGRCSDGAAVYEYFEFKSTGYDYEKGDYISESALTAGEKTVNFSVYNSAAEGRQMYTVIPYYPEQEMSGKIEKKLSENETGIFISGELAKLIGDSERGLQIGINVRVPVYLFETIMQNYVDDTVTEYEIDIDMTTAYSSLLEVEGVVRSDINNNYTDSGDYIIYMPYEKMREILDTCIEGVSKEGEFYSAEWNPSAMVVYAKDYTVIDSLVEDIKSVSPNLKCISQYQNIAVMNESIASVRQVMSVFGIIVLLIVVALMSIIYINRISGRKFEFAILKANGLRRGELKRLLFFESGIEVIYTVFVSVVMLFLLRGLSEVVFGSGMLDINPGMFIRAALISLVAINIPVFLALSRINKYSPEKILRN